MTRTVVDAAFLPRVTGDHSLLGMYRETSPTLVSALDFRLSPHGFAIVEPDEASRSLGIVRGYHRKTWNTNRAVFLARPESEGAEGLRAYVEALRRESGRVFGSSWWSQLGLQVVFEVEGAPPSEATLQSLVAMFNTQGILIQSVFAIEPSTLARTSARTWGQMITGKFQDAIASAFDDMAAKRPD